MPAIAKSGTQLCIEISPAIVLPGKLCQCRYSIDMFPKSSIKISSTSVGFIRFGAPLTRNLEKKLVS